MFWILLCFNLLIASNYGIPNTNKHGDVEIDKRAVTTRCQTFNTALSSLRDAIINDNIIYMYRSTIVVLRNCVTCNIAGDGPTTYFNCTNGIVNYKIENPQIVKYVPKQYIIVYGCNPLIGPLKSEFVYVLTASGKLDQATEADIETVVRGVVPGGLIKYSTNC